MPFFTEHSSFVLERSFFMYDFNFLSIIVPPKNKKQNVYVSAYTFRYGRYKHGTLKCSKHNFLMQLFNQLNSKNHDTLKCSKRVYTYLNISFPLWFLWDIFSHRITTVHPSIHILPQDQCYILLHNDGFMDFYKIPHTKKSRDKIRLNLFLKLFWLQTVPWGEEYVQRVCMNSLAVLQSFPTLNFEYTS